MSIIDPKLSVAPMMNWTDRHCRVFHRMLSNNTLLYTEMITTGAIIHGNRTQLLKFNEIEHPVALQLGGSDPSQLAEASKVGIDFGYDDGLLEQDIFSSAKSGTQQYYFTVKKMSGNQTTLRSLSQSKDQRKFYGMKIRLLERLQ